MPRKSKIEKNIDNKVVDATLVDDVNNTKDAEKKVGRVAVAKKNKKTDDNSVNNNKVRR